MSKPNFDMNNWQQVRMEDGSQAVRVQAGTRRWLTVCDVFCLTQGRNVWTTESTAKRIAAAPQMEEALKAMLKTYAPGADDSAAAGGEKVLHTAVRMARAALKKATQ